MLRIISLSTGYEEKQVIFNLDIHVDEGEIVALIGPNGAGKSTVLKAIHGLLPAWTGEIQYNGSSIIGFTPEQNVAHGITLLLQGNRIFHNMTVMENLLTGGLHLSRAYVRERIENILVLFPTLKDRIFLDAVRLSGGEQQMLALARALISKPKLLMLDEPSLGLAPDLLSVVFNKIKELNEDLGTSILIVEQKVGDVLEICNRVYSMKLGKVSFEGSPEELKEDKERLKDLFL